MTLGLKYHLGIWWTCSRDVWVHRSSSSGDFSMRKYRVPKAIFRVPGSYRPNVITATIAWPLWAIPMLIESFSDYRRYTRQTSLLN